MKEPSQNFSPDDPPSSANDLQSRASGETNEIKKKLVVYFYSNIMTIFWSAFLLFGGGIFIAYYAYIGYMPDFDLKSSATILATATTTTIAIIASLLLTLIYPGAIWNGAFGIDHPFCSSWKESEGDTRRNNLFIWVGGPMFIGIGVLVLSFFLDWDPIPLGLGIIFGIVVAISLWGFFFTRKNDEIQGFFVISKKLGLLSVLTLMNTCFIGFPLWLITNLYLQQDTPHTIRAQFAGIASIFFVFIANFLAAAPPKGIKTIYWYLGLGTVTLFLILVLSGQLHIIPGSIMRLYKFGNIPSSVIVLKGEACDVLSALNIETRKSKGRLCTASNILILSRLGQEAYLQHSDRTKRLKFTVPSSDLVSWSILENNDPPE